MALKLLLLRLVAVAFSSSRRATATAATTLLQQQKRRRQRWQIRGGENQQYPLSVIMVAEIYPGGCIYNPTYRLTGFRS